MCTLGCNCFWLIRAQYLEIAVRMGGGCSKTSRYDPADARDVIAAMRIKPTNEDVQLRGCEALANLAGCLLACKKQHVLHDVARV